MTSVTSSWLHATQAPAFSRGNLRNLRLAHVQKTKMPVSCESPVSMRLMRDKAEVKGVKSYALPRELLDPTPRGAEL